MGISLAAASLIAAAAGTAVSTLGAIQQGRAQQAAFEYQAQVARNNQIIAQRQAEDARARGDLEANLHRQQVRQLVGTQRAAMAGAGVVIDQDSALDLVTDTAGFGELDALTIRSNAEREALGFETQGMNFQAESQLNKLSAKNSMTSALFRAGGTLLSGAGDVASKWYTFKTKIQ